MFIASGLTPVKRSLLRELLAGGTHWTELAVVHELENSLFWKP